MLTKNLVIYDRLTLEVLRIIVADDDAHYVQFHEQTILPGEAFTYSMRTPQSLIGELGPSDLGAARNAVMAAHGYAPSC